jgi:hypothetical protein
VPVLPGEACIRDSDSLPCHYIDAVADKVTLYLTVRNAENYCSLDKDRDVVSS